MKAVIIGSGVSGLMSGVLLSRDGYDVEIYEQHSVLGGMTSLASQNGFSWEQGPLLLGDFLPGEKVYQALEELGIHLPVVRADRGIEMPDYSMWAPKDYEGPNWRKNRLIQLFPEEKKGIEKYYKLYHHLIKLSMLSYQKKLTIVDQLGKMSSMISIAKYQKYTAEQLMNYFFQSEKIKALFTGILADVCIHPSKFMGLGVPFFNIETAFDKRIPIEKNGKKVSIGYAYIEGGVQKLPEALADYITSRKGKIHLNQTVTKINITDKKVTGITLEDGKIIDADIVIASGGAKEVFYDLVGTEHLDDHYLNILETFQPMESVFMIHLGLDEDPLKYQQSALCYYYGTYDIENAMTKIESGDYHEGDEGFLIYIPSDHATDMAPKGYYAMTIYTVAPDTLKNGDWEDLKDQYADKLLRLAEEKIPHLTEHIVEKKIMTPLDYRKLAHHKHNAFGGVIPIMGIENPPHKTPVENLYFVGQQSENAGSVSNVLLGAKETYEKYIKKEAN